jgi:hypothetical protein
MSMAPPTKTKPGMAATASRFAHPILFALVPIAAVLGTNIEMTHPAEAIRPAAAAAVTAALLVVGMRLYLRDWGKAPAS